jgi:hypothetical protein
MISLVIVAMLLTAVAAAYSACASAINVNDEFFRATQGARVSMAQMLDMTRQSAVCRVGTEAENTAGVPPFTLTDKDTLYINTPAPPEGSPEAVQFPYGKIITYQYVPSDPDKPLKVTDEYGITHILARHVETCQFASTVELIDVDKVPHRATTRVTILLVIKVGENQLQLSGSTVPRQAMTY